MPRANHEQSHAFHIQTAVGRACRSRGPCHRHCGWVDQFPLLCLELRKAFPTRSRPFLVTPFALHIKLQAGKYKVPVAFISTWSRCGARKTTTRSRSTMALPRRGARPKTPDVLRPDVPTSEESVRQTREPDSCLLNLVLLTRMAT